MNSYLKHCQYIVYIFLGILMILLGCGEIDESEENMEDIQPKSSNEIIIHIEDLTPAERAQRLMRIVNFNRTEAYKLAKIQNLYFHLPETSDKIFKKVLGFEEGFANKLIGLWDLIQFIRKMTKEIDIGTFKRYENFKNIYRGRILNENGKPYFEYIGAYDEIIMEYIRIRFVFPDAPEEQILEILQQSLLEGNVDLIYPEGF